MWASATTPARCGQFAADAKMRMPVAIDDGSLVSWLQLEATPFHVLIGRDGRIAYAGHQDGPPLDAAIATGARRRRHAQPRSTRRRSTAVAALMPGDLVPAIDLRGSNDAPGRFRRRRHRATRGLLVVTATWCESYSDRTPIPDAVDACRRTREQVDALSQAGTIDWLGVVAHLWTTPQSLAAYEARLKPRVRDGRR